MMKRRDFADTLPLVLLGLMTIVGGLGGGMHSLFGCCHAPGTNPGPVQNTYAAFSAEMSAPRGTELQVAAPSKAALSATGCPVCTVLENYQALRPQASFVGADHHVVAAVPRVAAACRPQSSLAAHRPRGPPTDRALSA
jgi:hypothetical protein